MIVEMEVGCEALPGFFHRTIAFEIHFFILHRSPEPFREDVVQAPASAIHADFDAALFQNFREFIARELRTLIAVEDFRLSGIESFLESFNAEFFLHGDRKPEGHHIAGIPVEYGREICPPTGETNERDVRSPDVVVFHNFHAFEQIGVFLVIRVWNRGLWPAIDATETEFPHQGTDFLDANFEPLPDEFRLHLPFSVERAGGIDFIHRMEKSFIIRPFL